MTLNGLFNGVRMGYFIISGLIN